MAATSQVGSQVGSQVKLEKNQKKHVDKAIAILKEHVSFFDVSEPGTGKTWTSGYLSDYLNLPMIVFGPLEAHQGWHQLPCQVIKTYSYRSLVGNGKKGVKKYQFLAHQYLTREDEHFQYTKEWASLCDQGILLVFDEAQYLNGSSACNRGATQLIEGLNQAVIERGSESRCLLLSATPFEKNSHIVNLIKLLRLVTKERMYHRRGGSFVLEGLTELIDLAKYYDPIETDYLINNRKPDRKGIEQLIFLLYTEIIHPRFSHGMTITVDKRIYRGFFNVEKKERLEQVIKQLSKLNERKTKALQELELLLLSDLIRVAQNKINQYPEAKIILFVKYLASVNILSQTLSKRWSTLVHTGQVNQKLRQKIISQFQDDSGPRFLIATLTTGGTSLNLHDTTGKRPRFVYITPTYRMGKIHQACFRVFRQGQKSLGEAYIFYPREGEIIERIMINLKEKSQVMKKGLVKLDYDDLPGYYPKYIEDKPGELK